MEPDPDPAAATPAEVTSPVTLRPVRVDDVELLRAATVANLDWTGEQRFTYRDVDEAPHLRHYAEFRPDRGDFGFVAAQQGWTVGVVWLLFLDAAAPGYGFVADGVPELSISVWSGYRGQGIGQVLISAALDEARARGLARVSLSVETGNPALRLYRAAGFERADGTAEGTYVVRIG